MSKPPSTGWIDLFNAPKLNVASVFQYLHWFPKRKQKCPRFCIFNLHLETLWSTIRMSLERVDKPIWRAESAGLVHFHISPPVPKTEAKTFPKSQLLNLHLQTTWSTVRISVERVNIPIWCAEFNGTIYITVSLMVPNTEAKTLSILPFLNLDQQNP